MLRTALHGFRDLALLLARIALGVILIAHGWRRWLGDGIEAQVEILAAAGLPAADALAWLVVGFELAGGALLIFGLGTPIIGLGVLALNVGIILIRKFDAGLYLSDGGYEYNLALAAFGLIFLAFGSGRLGIDHLFLAPRRAAEAAEADDGPVSAPTPSEHTIFHREPTGDA
ncbi:MAG: DoxX family protein [Propionibacterium sp.]|nr:DoxX family protein [Propionibacterium sp.]